MASWILNWPRGVKIFVKVLLMLICCAGLCAAPLLLQKQSFTMSAGASIAASTVSKLFYSSIYLRFAIFLASMLLINLIFFIIDECKNDTVAWRRTLQVILNIAVIIAGVCTGFRFLTQVLPNLEWWAMALVATSFLKKLTWFPYLMFTICAVFQMIWDIWLFGPQNRNPWIARMLKRAALKSAKSE